MAYPQTPQPPAPTATGIPVPQPTGYGSLYYPTQGQMQPDPFNGRFGNNPGLLSYLLATGQPQWGQPGGILGGNPATNPPGTNPGGTPPPGGTGQPPGGSNGVPPAGTGGVGGHGNDSSGYHGNPGTGRTGLLGGRFLPGWASGMVSALPYGIGTAINGINSLSGLLAGQQQLGFLGQKMSIGDALSAATGMNLGYHAQGIGGYGNIGMGGYSGMQNMADPGVQGAARALSAHQVSSAFGSMANGGYGGAVTGAAAQGRSAAGGQAGGVGGGARGGLGSNGPMAGNGGQGANAGF